jgi:hypothetical protein
MVDNPHRSGLDALLAQRAGDDFGERLAIGLLRARLQRAIDKESFQR